MGHVNSGCFMPAGHAKTVPPTRNAWTESPRRRAGAIARSARTSVAPTSTIASFMPADDRSLSSAATGGCPWGNGSHADTAEQRGHRARFASRAALLRRVLGPLYFPQGHPPATAPRGGTGPGMNDAQSAFRPMAGHERCSRGGFRALLRRYTAAMGECTGEPGKLVEARRHLGAAESG